MQQKKNMDENIFVQEREVSFLVKKKLTGYFHELMVVLKKRLIVIVYLFISEIPLSSDANFLASCKDSLVFIIRTTEAITKLDTQLDIYEKSTPSYLIKRDELENTLNRFNTYGNQGLFCGADGLPHLIIIDLQKGHVGELLYPGYLFLVITGYIGWIGRSYLYYTKTITNPVDNEIIINIIVAIGIVTTSFFWPLVFWKELTTSKLLVVKDETTISSR